MEQLFDLSITLTQLLPGSPSGGIASFTLNCDALSLNYRGGIVKDPFIEIGNQDLVWYLTDFWKWPYGGFARRGKDIEAQLPRIGMQLYQTLFNAPEASALVKKWRRQRALQHQISIISDVPAALNLPWELLHDTRHFLIQHPSRPISIARRLPHSTLKTDSSFFEPPLRILLITARPDDVEFTDPRIIARELLHVLREHSGGPEIEVRHLRPPTLTRLYAYLRETKDTIHVLHFDGHGSFDKDSQRGKLAFEDDGGLEDAIDAETLLDALQDSQVQLVVLTACQSAVGSADDAFSSLATQLVQGGIGAVVAMSAPILVSSAARYVGTFYRGIAEAMSLSAAHMLAQRDLYRQSLQRKHGNTADQAASSLQIRDWWVPNFYQQRPLALQTAAATSDKEKLPVSTLPIPLLGEQVPVEAPYGFSGRVLELQHIERWLLQSKLVVCYGFGGIGKTTLVCEAARWLVETGMFSRACFISFEQGGNTTWFLSELGTYLGINDSSYNPDDQASALKQLKRTLIVTPTLIIVDNLESILPRGSAELPAAERAQLWSILLALGEIPTTGVLLTSRSTALNDPRMQRGRVKYRNIAGLQVEAAFALAEHILAALHIHPERAPYTELRALLAQLDYHPLAIQLVLPTLCDLSLEELRSRLAALLPRFVDDEATGRNRSLLASLEYSLYQLTEDQRSWLPRMALFQGGTNEETFLRVTTISEDTWKSLCTVLRQAGLLTIEAIHEDLLVSFIHLHPVLLLSLQRLPDANSLNLQMRYAQCYEALAGYLYQEDARELSAVRALVRRELPNMRHALDLLLDLREYDLASQMVSSLAWFLSVLGHDLERNELLLKVRERLAPANLVHAGPLTPQEYLQETNLGEVEYQEGRFAAAAERFEKLLTWINAQQQGTILGPGSYEHCLTLHRLSRSLREDNELDTADDILQRAFTIIDELIKHHPDLPLYIRERGLLLTEKGAVLRNQGHYEQAKETYELAMSIAEQTGDLRQQVVSLERLGEMSLARQDYLEATAYYKQALQIEGPLQEPLVEAALWFQLGRIAEEQQQWINAEGFYRRSLECEERRKNEVGIAITCRQLAILAMRTHRYQEARDWIKRAIKIDKKLEPGGVEHAKDLTNFAMLLLDEAVVTRTFSKQQLEKARRYVERSQAMLLEQGEVNWQEWSILAEIAELKGQTEKAHWYREQERAVFARSPGNRENIEQQFETFIATMLLATQGDNEARNTIIEEFLPQMERDGWSVSDAVQQLWKGERDWNNLADALHLDNERALLVLLILERLPQSEIEVS